MRIPILFLAIGLLAGPAAAGVFRCQDGGGKVAYQSEPCGTGSRQNEVRVRDDRIDPDARARPSDWKGFTPPKVAAITFYYDAADEPVGFSTGQMEADIRAAMDAWMAGCNVRLSYGGRRPSPRGGSPDHVPIRWEAAYMQAAHPADGRSGIAATGGLLSGIQIKPRFREADMRSLLVHEMGHVLGLPHNHGDRQSIMSYLQDESSRRNARPNAGDFRDCNESMKAQFGVDFQPPADAPLPTGPRMSDKEALERINGKPGR